MPRDKASTAENIGPEKLIPINDFLGRQSAQAVCQRLFQSIGTEFSVALQPLVIGAENTCASIMNIWH